jgi:hypothetical protein
VPLDDTEMAAVLGVDVQAAFGAAVDVVAEESAEQIASRWGGADTAAGTRLFGDRHLARRHREH